MTISAIETITDYIILYIKNTMNLKKKKKKKKHFYYNYHALNSLLTLKTLLQFPCIELPTLTIIVSCNFRLFLRDVAPLFLRDGACIEK